MNAQDPKRREQARAEEWFMRKATQQYDFQELVESIGARHAARVMREEEESNNVNA